MKNKKNKKCNKNKNSNKIQNNNNSYNNNKKKKKNHKKFIILPLNKRILAILLTMLKLNYN